MNRRNEEMIQTAATVDRPVQPRRRFLQRHGGLVVTLVLLLLGAIFVLMPLYWLVFDGLQERE